MMKKLILMFAMVFMAFSSSFAYDNGIGVMATPYVNSDSQTATINQYCDIEFSYVIHRADPNYLYSGSVFLRQGGAYIAGTEIIGSNDSNYNSDTKVLTRQWYTLTLTSTASNGYAHGLLYW
ncbi:hypothetical protein KZP23_22315 [Echinicola marina]|uniref:hypothetical protein n=1 Tax=Echinicola marina TaxID=2859768 RepID=UPI001CF6AADA|nr:hypothetical protein [Echinicola marina]UCS93345.1 hypothetical protein KZP23_22315 [Echinicola marina]